MKLRNCLALLGLMVGLAAGCNTQPQYSGPPPQPIAYQQQPQMVNNAPIQQVTQQNFLMRAEAFNLGQVVSMLKTSQITDAASLEKVINDPSTAINNVDVDNDGAGDGQIDFIGVQEAAAPNGKRYEFMAYPSSQQGKADQKPVTVATVNVTVVNNMVTVNAGYPSYVHGYHEHYYNDSYRLARDMLFLSWMLSPRPFYISRPYYSAYWSPRPVFAPSYVTSTRTSYSTRTNSNCTSPTPASSTTYPARASPSLGRPTLPVFTKCTPPTVRCHGLWVCPKQITSPTFSPAVSAIFARKSSLRSSVTYTRLLVGVACTSVTVGPATWPPSGLSSSRKGRAASATREASVTFANVHAKLWCASSS